MGERQVIVARELTKMFEEFIRGTASEVIDAVSRNVVRGEVVLLIAPGEDSHQETEPPEEMLRRLLADGKLSVKDAAKQAALTSGVSRSEAYAMALQIKKEQEHS
jgi:16S rRNA (cytidine1402-2'-O)-methyltransferase